MPPTTPHPWHSRAAVLLRWLTGESSTTITEGSTEHQSITLETTNAIQWPAASITCTRIIFTTKYTRRWMRPVVRNFYEVSISVQESLYEHYGKEIFAPATYPMLCNRFFKWTTYPHLLAISAYLDELYRKLKVHEKPPLNSSISSGTAKNVRSHPF